MKANELVFIHEGHAPDDDDVDRHYADQPEAKKLTGGAGGAIREVSPVEVAIVVLIRRPALGCITDGCGGLLDGADQVEIVIRDLKGHGEHIGFAYQ